MKHALRIGRIWGIPLRVHWSFALLILLVVWGTPTSKLASIVASVLWLVIIFSCVVLHELAHCVVARRRGLVVSDIVLLPIGGVSEIEGLGRSAADELPIAAAGPASSFALAAALLAAVLASGRTPWPPELTTGSLLVRSMWANVVLGAFNLLPALPLDGGRVLRAALARRRPEPAATMLAARVSTAIGYLMIFVGVFVDLLLALIGFFVVLAAQAEASIARVRADLGDLRVRDLAIRDPLTLQSDLDLRAVSSLLASRPGESLPVLAGGRYLGMVSSSDLDASRPDLTLGDVVDSSAALLDPDSELYPEAEEAFHSSRRHELAVGHDGTVVGLLYESDLEALLRRRARGHATT